MSEILHLQPPEAPSKTVVCIHGSAGSGRQWRPLGAWLRDDLQLVTPDLLGCEPGGAWRIGSPISLAEEAERLAPLLEAPLGGVHLLAHSYGGAVALELARTHPERIRSLTVYEPARFGLLLGETPTPAAAEQIVSVGRRVQLLVLSGCLRDAASFFVDYWMGEGTWAALGVEQQASIARRMPKVQAEFEALFNDRAPAAAFAALSMPVHLIGGLRSPLPARQVLDRLAAVIPNATVARVAGLGHMAPVTDAAAVAPHLPAWLRHVEQQRAA
jgi:pimeloyl-ACP methyl ester carboxylesterase